MIGSRFAEQPNEKSPTMRAIALMGFMSRASLMRLLQPLDQVCSRSRAGRPERVTSRPVGCNAANKTDRTIAEDKIYTAWVFTGEVVQTSVSVGRDIDPVVVY